MSQTLDLQSAQKQYYERPADERFASLADLRAAAQDDLLRCVRVDLPLASLTAQHVKGEISLSTAGTVSAGPVLNHWTFGQLCKAVGAPAGYLRTLDTPIVVDALNFGLKHGAGWADREKPAQLYLRRQADSSVMLRAITSQDYARLNDVDVVDRLITLSESAGLDLPPVWEGGKGGAYRGDQDSFVILVSGGSIVEDPTLAAGKGRMNRGIIVRNSEVGAAQIEVFTFLFRYICGNHMIMGATETLRTSSRHVGNVAGRFELMLKTAMDYFQQPAGSEEYRISQLALIELGKDKDAVIVAGREAGLTEAQSEESYAAAEQHEQNPRSVWGFANGITRVSQLTPWQNVRMAMDLVARKLLGRKLAE